MLKDDKIVGIQFTRNIVFYKDNYYTLLDIDEVSGYIINCDNKLIEELKYSEITDFKKNNLINIWYVSNKDSDVISVSEAIDEK